MPNLCLRPECPDHRADPDWRVVTDTVRPIYAAANRPPRGGIR